ncbi:hypothetical protein [Jannaschia seohaensis]|uniref:Uncharacterized protein n=1 Tax=Jannaschia seohaensis TaxID=475081 RepID=A0A2Y9B2G0_9RHOB|nr:hypothetical protein [Jannaschia seohaensis]PWJ12906.1 hypothetical protein BCF38_11542 [Jannaschia seohaensis]SSA50714.1 hypothetical protein SAMN05421539_11542 [Jannaschia seohaensis]
MRTIVHFGMSKAGSTALQKGLVQAREALLERGVLYPKAPIISHSHNLLSAGLVPPGEIPRFVRHSLEKVGAGPDLCDRWLAALGEAMARGAAKTLVLSAENLWGLRDAEAAARLRERLVGIGATRIEAVAYLRRPSDWYLSMAGQVLAASHRIKPAEPVPYRASIEPMAQHLADASATRLRLYDRTRFPGGDIVADFLERTLEIGDLPAPGREANVSLSAEGLDLLRSYRLHAHPDENGQFTPDTRRVMQALERAEAATPGHARPRLRADLADRLDHGAPDLLWLRDAHGLVFDGIEYDRIETGDWRKRFGALDEVCLLDPARREALAQRGFQEMATALEAHRKRRRRRNKAKGQG